MDNKAYRGTGTSPLLDYTLPKRAAELFHELSEGYLDGIASAEEVSDIPFLLRMKGTSETSIIAMMTRQNQMKKRSLLQ